MKLCRLSSQQDSNVSLLDQCGVVHKEGHKEPTGGEKIQHFYYKFFFRASLLMYVLARDVFNIELQ